MEKCVICHKLTGQGCSLCRKAYYCSQLHQELDWHKHHKFSCEGRQQQSAPHSPPPAQGHKDKAKEEFDEFAKIFEQRLKLRGMVYAKYRNLKPKDKQLEKICSDCQRLVKLSKQLSALYKPNMQKLLLQQYNFEASNFLMHLQEIADIILQCKLHFKAQMFIDARKYVLQIAAEMPEYIPQQFKSIDVYRNLLAAAINASEFVNNDHASVNMYAKFIRMIQKTQGSWEQIYAYYNMALWFSKKTYYYKALKTYEHTLKLVDKQKINHKEETDAVNMFKGDCIYNYALTQFGINEIEQATKTMQEAYKLRVKTTGKNSIETSDCLEQLARWTFKMQSWESCLQYLEECYRIRKQNPSHPQELERITKLVIETYQIIREEKKKSQKELNPQQEIYYSKLLQDSLRNEQVSNFQAQQSFAQKLNAPNNEDKLPFKVNISQEMVGKINSKQWDLFNQLFALTDIPMSKEEIYKHLFESSFINSLDEALRQEFIKINSF